MQRDLWRKSYGGSLPQFTCPRCGKGKLVKQGDLIKQEPRHVTEHLEEIGLSGQMSDGRFVGMLICSYQFCGEVVTVAGGYTTREEVHWNDDADVPERYEFSKYYPYSIRPAPVVIEEPEKLGAEAKKHLRKAYELLWNDCAACANRLRIFAESLLDQLTVPRQGKKRNGKNGELDLSERIDALEVTRPGHQKALNALRYVGNVGSHEGEADFDDLLDCFEYLEYTLIELIDERRARLEAKADDLLRRKGRPKSK